MDSYTKVPTRETSCETEPEPEEIPKNEQCGLNSCRPIWLQKFANIYMYTIVYGLGAVVHGMLYAYFISVITTMEKRFSISSSMTGLILAGNDFTQVFCGLAVTYFGARGSPPFVMGAGSYIMAVSCILMASVELFPMMDEGLTVAQRTGGQELCVANASFVGPTECSDAGSYTTAAVTVLMIAQGLYGIGSSSIYSLGMAYLDDNISKARFPLFMGAIASIRMLGPVIGFVLGAFCLKVYRNPTEDPGYDNRDPRWIGAWWIGFVVVGVLNALQGFLVSLFPRKLPNKNMVKVEEKPAVRRSLKDFWQVVKRIGSNATVVCYALSGVFFLIGIVGFSTFQPKYLESQFRQSASAASFLTGLTGLPLMILGFIIGGIVLWRLKPRALVITSWAVITGIIFLISFGVLMFLACTRSPYTNSYFENGRVYTNSSCVADCNCGGDKPSPVCVEGKDYLSPCYAGCSSVRNYTAPGGKPIFANCSCAASTHFINETSSIENSILPDAIKGYCGQTCELFIPYIVINALEKLIGATARVGGSLIPLRIVDKDDKSMVMGFMITLLDVFAFIPTPIIYGAAVDSTCILWENKCGRRGNCWMYDVDKLRYVLHGMTLCFVSIGVFFEIIVTYLTRNMSFFDEDDDKEKTLSNDPKPPNIVFSKTATNDGMSTITYR